MKRLAPLAAVICCLALPARADLAAGRDAFRAGDYKTAVAELKPLAGHDPEAALLLGQMAQNGLGLPRSDSAAWGYYKQAADGGQVDALVRAAGFAELGRGVPVDRHLAYTLYKRAAEAGNMRARGRMGEMALTGRGRKINSAEALVWLRQAALADDPEANALLDDLAAKGRVLPLPAGSANPPEPAARRVLDEVRQVVADMSLALGPESRIADGGEVTALSRPDGSVLVTVPAVTATRGAATYKEGSFRLVFRDIGDYTAKVQVLLPSHVQVEDADGAPIATLALSGQQLSGVWDFGLHALTDLHAEVASLGVALRGIYMLSLQGLTVERHVTEGERGRYGVVETAGADNVALRVNAGVNSLGLAAAGLTLRGEVRDLDFAAFRRWAEAAGIDWRTGSLLMQMLVYGGDGAARLPPMMAHVDSALSVEQLNAVGVDQRPVLGFRRLDLALGLGDLTKPLSSAHLSYAHDGLEGVSVAGLPGRANASLTLDRLPMAELLRSLAAFADGFNLDLDPAVKVDVAAVAAAPASALLGAMTQSGARVQFDEVGAAGEGWDLAANGRAVPAPGGVTLGFDVLVHGLDALLVSSGPRIGRTAGDALRDAAKTETDDKDRPVSRLQLAVPPGGGVLVNGRAVDFGG